MTEICMLVWILAIYAGARFAPFPTNLLCWLWLAGMPLCIPFAASISAKRDPKTTICREMLYFLRRGAVLIRIVFWPITLLGVRFGESQRSAHISETYHQLRDKNYYMKHDTAIESAQGNAFDMDKSFDVVQKVAAQAMDVATEIPVAAARTGVVAAALTGAAVAQTPTQTSPTVSIFLARTGERLQQPYQAAYRMFEFLQVRGDWIYPDLGCVDYQSGTYRECFIGGGRTIFKTKKITLVGEAYFVQATGPAAHSARYLWLNPILDVRITPKLTSQTSYFPYVPLNKPARVQQVLERSKLEYAFTKHVKVGGGIGAYQFGDGAWQRKPLATITFSTKAGSLELWAQKIPQGALAQVRYSFVHTAKH